MSFYELVDSLLNGTYHICIDNIIICVTLSQRSIRYCIVLVSDSPNDKAKQIKFDKLLNPNVIYLYLRKQPLKSKENQTYNITYIITINIRSACVRNLCYLFSVTIEIPILFFNNTKYFIIFLLNKKKL